MEDVRHNWQRHAAFIRNVFAEGELVRNAVYVRFAHTAADGSVSWSRSTWMSSSPSAMGCQRKVCVSASGSGLGTRLFHRSGRWRW